MRQLNKDGQKQVNYVICIPPMCTEKGVRLQHKFIVNKDDEDEIVSGGRSLYSFYISLHIIFIFIHRSMAEKTKKIENKSHLRRFQVDFSTEST